MKINVIGSGSKGNCTAVTAGNETILLDAGINFDRIQRALNFENPVACFITHEHGDHANLSTVNELSKRGVDIYMTAGTLDALKLEKTHRLHIIKPKLLYGFDGDFKFYALPVIHDAAEPVCFNFVINNESIKYITDTNQVPAGLMLPQHLIIEANYNFPILLGSGIDNFSKTRILNNHLSIEKVLDFLEMNSSTVLQEIHLMHISKRHGDPKLFAEMVKAVVDDNVKVFSH